MERLGSPVISGANRASRTSISSIIARIGSRTSRSYSERWVSNQDLTLFCFRPRRKRSVAVVNAMSRWLRFAGREANRPQPLERFGDAATRAEDRAAPVEALIAARHDGVPGDCHPTPSIEDQAHDREEGTYSGLGHGGRQDGQGCEEDHEQHHGHREERPVAAVPDQAATAFAGGCWFGVEEIAAIRHDGRAAVSTGRRCPHGYCLRGVGLKSCVSVHTSEVTSSPQPSLGSLGGKAGTPP